MYIALFVCMSLWYCSLHQSFMKKLSELEVHSWCGEFLPLFKEYLISRHHPTEQGHPCWSHCMVCHHRDLQTMSESDTCMNILLTWRANSRSCKTSQSISINFCWIRFTFCGTLTQTSIAYELWENIQAITSMQHVRSQSGKAICHSSVAGGWTGSELAKAWCQWVWRRPISLCKQSLNPMKSGMKEELSLISQFSLGMDQKITSMILSMTPIPTTVKG